MNFVVDGIVAVRDKQPYLRFFADGQRIGQVSMAEARKIAADIVQMAARTEADAMIHRFFSNSEYPVEAANALMLDFRNFRSDLDSEKVEGRQVNPETGEEV